MSEQQPEVVTKALVQDVQLPADGGTLALITLDNGHDHTKPNTFGLEGMSGLSTQLEILRTRAEAGEIAAVAVTGKPFIFAVGADLSGVPGVSSREQALEIARAGHTAYAAVMDLPVPTFAFVNGAAMGGGVELSLACDYRTMSKAVPAVALPEVFLGLVPGWGGCYLLPRLLGPEKALKVIVENPLNTNRMLTGPKAAELGLADELLDAADFLEQSIIWAAKVLAGEVTVEREPVSDDAATWEAAAAAATQLADGKTAGKSPSPYRAIELVTAARTADRDAAFAAEDEALADLLMGEELRAGLYSFDLVQKRAKRPAGAPDKSLARPVGKVGIVGAGLMASQLAMLFIRALKVPVVMTDLDQDRVDKGVGYVHSEID
ncbi:MAG: enoyl-CoA hydratase-related protein, partial [Cellulosimicrobium funkei]